MTEFEVPMEKVQQDMEHAAHGTHGSGAGQHKDWITWSALLSAFLAVAAAVAALSAGGQVNKAMISQMRASDSWSFYQAKSIKQNIADTRLQLLVAMGKEEPTELREKIKSYGLEQKEIQEKAKRFEEDSEFHFSRHEVFAESVTFFQIAIAVTAIAVLARRRKFLLVALLFGIGGLFFLSKGFLFTKAESAPVHEAG